MKRSDLVALLAEENPDLRRNEVIALVDLFFEEITLHLSAGGRVELRGFGVFTAEQRKAQPGHNPHTGEALLVPERQVARFKPAKLMHSRIQPR